MPRFTEPEGHETWCESDRRDRRRRSGGSHELETNSGSYDVCQSVKGYETCCYSTPRPCEGYSVGGTVGRRESTCGHEHAGYCMWFRLGGEPE